MNAHSALQSQPKNGPRTPCRTIGRSLVSECRHTFNERTGTLFNYLEYTTDFAVLWWRRYTLSLCDLAEIFLEGGFKFTHETVRDWGSMVCLVDNRSASNKTA